MNRSLRSLEALAAIALLAALAAAGCNNNPADTDTPPSGFVKGISIITDPLAPAPGDTTTLTAQVTGKSYTWLPTYEWSADQGTIVTATGISTQWVPPNAPGIYHILCRVTLDASVDTLHKYIMVRRFEAVNTGLRYSLYPNFGDEGLLLIGTPNALTDNAFYGFHVYLDNITNKITTATDITINGGLSYQFLADEVLTSCVTGGQTAYRQQPANVIFFPLSSFGQKRVVTNEIKGTLARKNRNLYPYGSSDASYAVWQRHAVGALETGTEDSVNVMYRFGTIPSVRQKLLTRSAYSRRQSCGVETCTVYYYYRNIKPMLTPDESYIVYFCDSTEIFEPCLIPMEGTDPDTTGRIALMVDDQRGIFEAAGIKVSESTVFEWDPGSSGLLAFIEENNKRICFFDYTARTVGKIDGLKATELAWGPNSMVAAIVDSGVVAGTPGGTGDYVFRKERLGDAIIGLTWASSATDPLVAFRLVRKGKGNTESFSAIVIVSLNEGRWYYASPAVPWATEPEFDDYTWMRLLFEPDNTGIYVPISTPNPGGGGRVVIYHSY